MSDRNLRRTSRIAAALPAVLVVAAACGGGEAAPEPPAIDPNVPQAGPPLEIPELTDAELMGASRAQIVLNLPWSDRVFAKDPAPGAPRATLRAFAVEDGPGFDRASFTFGTDAPFPGYRVVWNDARTATCGGEPGTLSSETTLLVSFEPATARDDDGGSSVAERSLRPGLPAITSAAEICDSTSRLTWALAATDSARVRVVELRDPARLLVDVQHPEVDAP